jgi:hypothetical protein
MTTLTLCYRHVLSDRILPTQDAMPVSSRYEWIHECAGDLGAFTVAVIEGCSESEVIRGYGGDPDHPIGAMTFEAAEPDLYGSLPPPLENCFVGVPADEAELLLRTLTHERYVVALENNGFAGVQAALARKLSRDGGRFFGVFRNVNAVTRIVQAIDGNVVADFEPMFSPKSADEYGYPAWRTDKMFEVESLETDMLEAMTQQTGLVLRREWFEQELPTYRIPMP